MALGCLLAWTALRRNDGSGLGVAYACAVGHPRRLDRVLTVLSCAIGRPIRCGRVSTVLRVLGGFRRFRGFRGLRAGKRQAWTPIRSLRSHCCGLGVPVGVDRAEKKRWIWPWGSLSGLGVAYACAVGHPIRLDRVLTVLSCAVGRPIRCGRVLTVLRVLGVLGV